MAYSIEVIRKEDQSTTTWSGGTTTQLAIYPKDSAYSERNFLWRLSSAKVELEESTFTFLPGFWRIIMVLDGEMDLEHENHHKVHLKSFEQDAFSGEWTTKSVGKVTDFNLMLGRNCTGQLEAVQLDMSEKRAITQKVQGEGDQHSRITEAFYCVTGIVEISVNETDKITLQKGDMAIVNFGQRENFEVCLQGLEDQVRVVRSSIIQG